MEGLAILLPAFAFSVLLVGTHTYLGLHVLARGIIFIDLALAQVAALGMSVAFVLGRDAHGAEAGTWAFGATLLAALLFSGLRRLPDKTAREVTIGCVYVVTTALSIVLLSRSVQGMEALRALLNGTILWVRWTEIGPVAGVYAVLAALHAAFGRRFLALSSGGAGSGGRSAFLWEFLFFSSFAVVITLAVRHAGVLLVFAFLIIPAFSASLITDGFGRRLGLGWALGLLAAVLGLYVSYAADLPTGATMVSVMGALPLAALAWRVVTKPA